MGRTVLTRPRPYVGVTGFMHENEPQIALAGLVASSDPLPPPLSLMVGVLVSSKTLAGKLNKYPYKYPRVEDISKIFPDSPYALNLIHYATDDLASLPDQLSRLANLGGPNLHGFQLNISWPSYQLITKYKDENPDKKIVLQIGDNALRRCKNDPRTVQARINDYFGLIDYVLLDRSCGNGIPLDLNETLKYLRVVRDYCPWVGIGIAGGLSHETMDLVERVESEIPEISTDAEGRLRDNEGNLDLGLTMEYIEKRLAIVSSRP